MANEHLLSEQRKQIILDLAENNMKVTETARKIFMHRNTVVFHVRRIREITGKDPLNFYDLCGLVAYVKMERMGDDGKAD